MRLKFSCQIHDAREGRTRSTSDTHSPVRAIFLYMVYHWH